MTAAPALKTAAMLALIFAAIMAACVWLLGCVPKSETNPQSVGPVPAVAAKNDFIAAHAHAILLVLDRLDGVELAPAAALLVQTAKGHAAVIAAAVSPPSEPQRTAAEAMQPADLPVVLARASELAGAERAALNAAAEKQQRESKRAAAKEKADAVLAAKRQERLDTLSDVFTWLAGLAGLVGGAASIAAAASIVTSIPVLSDARRALICVAAVSFALGAIFTGAVMSLNYPWVFVALGAALVAALIAGGYYLLNLPSPKRPAVTA